MPSGREPISKALKARDVIDRINRIYMINFGFVFVKHWIIDLNEENKDKLDYLKMQWAGRQRVKGPQKTVFSLPTESSF